MPRYFFRSGMVCGAANRFDGLTVRHDISAFKSVNHHADRVLIVAVEEAVTVYQFSFVIAVKCDFCSMIEKIICCYSKKLSQCDQLRYRRL